MRRLAFLAAILLTACHHSVADQTAYMRHLAPPVAPVTPTPDPTYLAKDYSKPGHPRLTRNEAQLIRKTLVAVKACQLQFLRYAFPENSPGIVLYFGGPDAGDFPVLWNRNEDYRVDQGLVAATSATVPGPDLRSVASIRKIGCNPQLSKYVP